MSRRRLRFRDNSGAATFDLNLAPMLDMFVSIIPFMLLSATFITIMIVDVPLPVPVAQALQEDRQKQEREVNIQVTFGKADEMLIQVKEPNGKTDKIAVRKNKAEHDYTDLHTKLVEIKKVHPKIFRLELAPRDDVDYQTIVRVMDSARNMDTTDPKIMIDGSATPLLFPDVVLANMMD